MNRVTVITAPEREPVTLAEAKTHIAVDSSDYDDLITVFIKSATEHCEAFLGRALIERTLDYFLDEFPDDGEPIELPLPPIIAVTGVFYTDSAGVEQQFTDFETDAASEPARLYLTPSNSWPSPRVSANAVRIRYRAGYVDTSVSPEIGEVPADIRAAILLTVGTLYEHRETVVVGQTPSMMPWSAEQLLRMRRVEKSMA